MNFSFDAIGTFHSTQKENYQVPFQVGFLEGFTGYIELEKGQNFESALCDLQDFERIWLVFAFHKAKGWKPKVYPPRGDEKRGLFATRSPHRPNSIGFSAVKVTAIEGLRIFIEDHDLLDGTPILDIKPYLPYVDSFPNSEIGWMKDLQDNQAIYQIHYQNNVQEQLTWLENYHKLSLGDLIDTALQLHPLPRKNNRIKKLDDNHYRLACKTWRFDYSIDEEDKTIELFAIHSGYSEDYLSGQKQSKWDDVPIHQAFLKVFPKA